MSLNTNAWKVLYDDRRVEYVPGDDLLDALQEARRRQPKYGLDRVVSVEWQRYLA